MRRAVLSHVTPLRADKRSVFSIWLWRTPYVLEAGRRSACSPLAGVFLLQTLAGRTEWRRRA